jgi:Fe-coproporphyrin III synthase
LLITDKHLKSIEKNGFKPSFQISFDGIDTHDYMRGVEGTEAKVLEAIKRIQGFGFPVIISTSLDRLTAGSINSTYEAMVKIGVSGWRIAVPQAAGNWKESGTMLTMQETADILEPVFLKWIAENKPFFLQLGGFFRGEPLSEKISDFQKAPDWFPESYDCALCREQPNLLPDGTLVPCAGYVDSNIQSLMPNLLNTELSECWTNSLLRTFADMKKKDLLAANPDCVACDLFKECGMGCRASAYFETGDIMAKDPIACELRHVGYKNRFESLQNTLKLNTETPSQPNG